MYEIPFSPNMYTVQPRNQFFVLSLLKTQEKEKQVTMSKNE